MDYKNITMKIPLLCVIVPVGLGGVVLVRSANGFLHSL